VADAGRYCHAAGAALIAVIAGAAGAHAVGMVLETARADPIGGLVVAATLVAIAVLLLSSARYAARGRRQATIALVGAVVVAVAVRLVVLAVLDAPVDRDMRYYDETAAGFLAGECCFAARPLGYPVLLAGTYGLLGRGAFAGEMLNLLAATAGAVALAVVVRRSFGAAASVVAVMLYGFWPAGALMTSARMAETVYTSQLLVAAVPAVLGGARWGLATGAVVGLSQYVRALSAGLMPAFLLAGVLGARSKRAVVLGAVATVVAFLLVLAPVMYHNLTRHGELSVSTHSYGGLSLWQGTDQESGGRFSWATWTAYPNLSPGDLWEDGKVAAALGLGRIRDDPVGFLALQPRKFAHTWGSEDYGLLFAVASTAPADPQYGRVRLAGQLFYVFVTGAAAVTLWIRRREPLDRLMLLAIAMTASTALVHVFLEARERYHMYVVPLLMAVAAVEIARVVERLDRGPRATGPSVPRAGGAEDPK
jgi:hypothetical protein